MNNASFFNINTFLMGSQILYILLIDKVLILIIIKIINKQIFMDNPIQEYKLWKRKRLLAPYLNNLKFQTMISQIHYANVKKFGNILKEDQVEKLTNGLKEIDFIKSIPAEDLEIFELQRLIYSYGLTAGKNLEVLKKLMLKKKSQITIQDVNENTQYSGITLDRIQQFISSQAFKVWCGKYPQNQLNKKEIPQKKQVSSQQVINPAPVNNIIEQQIQDENIWKKFDDKAMRRIMKDDQEALNKEKNHLLASNLYDVSLLQLKLLEEKLNFLRNPLQLQYKFDDIYQMIKNDDRLKSLSQVQNKIEKLKAQKFSFYDAKIENYNDFKIISSYLEPIQASYIEQHAKNDQNWKINNGIIIIGDTGAGKSTFIQKMLGYPFEYFRINGLIQLQLSNKLKKEHQNLEASDSQQSVTKKMNKYEIKLGNKTFHLIDSPGFSDTGGPIIEIINQIHLEKVYKHIDNICYLYLLQISRYANPSDSLPDLSKQIAERFSYNIQNELKGILLIVFNNKYRTQQSSIKNTIKLSEDLYKQQNSINNKFRLTPNSLIALRYIVDSMKEGVFDPILNNSCDRIKQKISKLEFNKQNKIKINLNRKTLSLIQKNNRILRHNVEYFLAHKNIKNMMYFYNQICVLHNFIPLSIEKVKNIIDQKIKKSFSSLMAKFTSNLSQKIKKFTIKQEEFDELFSFYQQLQELIKFISKSNTSMISDQDIKEKLAQINIYLKDSVDQKNQSQIKKIVYIVQKLVHSQLKSSFQDIFKEIEVKCIKNMQNLRDSIKVYYEQQSYMEYDEKTRFFFTYKQFYQQFSCDNASIFNRKQKIAQIQGKISKNLTKYNDFLAQMRNQSLKISQSIEKNENVSLESIKNLNNLYRKTNKFYQSKYIPMKQNLDTFAIEYKQNIISLSGTLQQKIEQFLESNDEAQEYIAGIQIIKHNIDLCLKQFELPFIKQIFLNLKQGEQRKVNSKKQKIKIALEKSLEKHQGNQKHEQIYNLNRKIRGISIFSDSLDKVKTLHQQLKKHFYTLAAQLKHLIDKFQLKDKKNKIKPHDQNILSEIFTKLNILNIEYSEIQIDFKNESNKIDQQLTNKLKTHLSLLKQSMIIKQLKNQASAKKFNHEYVHRVELYINNYQQPCKISGYFEKTRQENIEVYKTIFQTIRKVEQLVKLCGDVALNRNKNAQKMMHQHESNNQTIINAISQKFSYIRILKNFYEILNAMQKSKIYGFLDKGLNDQYNLEIGEIISHIQEIQSSRKKQINFEFGDDQISHIATISMETLNKVRCECKQFRSLELLIEHHIEKKDENLSKYKNFQQLEVNIIKITKIKQKAQQNQLEEYIDIKELKIPYLQNCRTLYEQLKRNSQFTDIFGRSLKINHFVDRLNIFFARRIELISNDIFKINNTISMQLNNLLRELIRYSTSFHSYITEEDIHKYKIYSLEEFDEQIESILKKVQNQLLSDYIDEIESTIKLRDFKKVKMFLDILIKLQSQVSLYERRKGQQVIPVQNESMQSQNMANQFKLSLKLKKFIKELNDKFRQKEINQNNILQHPFQGNNYEQIITVYEKLTDIRKKSKLKARINHQVSQLLRQFQDSKVIEKQFLIDLQEKLTFIPNELKQQYGFIRKLDNIKQQKLNKYITAIQKIKTSNTKSQQKINQLLKKYILFANEGHYKLRNKCRQLIFEFFDEKMSQIYKCNEGSAKIIQLAVNYFWCLKVKDQQQCQDKREDIQQRYKTYNKNIHDILKKTFQNFNKQIKYYIRQEKCVIQHSFEHNVDQLFKIYEVLHINKYINNIPFPQDYIQLNQNIERLIKSVKNNFLKYCPIDRYFQIINTENLENITFLNKNLNNWIQKTVVYKIIMNRFENLAIINEEPSSVQPKANQECTIVMMDVEVNDNESLNWKIKSFQSAIMQQINRYNIFFNEFNFENHQIIRSSRLHQENIRNMLLQLDNKLKLLEIHCNITRKEYFGIHQIDINQKIINLRNNLEKTIQNFKTKFIKSIESLEVQVPNESSALQMILSQINNGYGERIFKKPKSSNEQSSMKDINQIQNPLLYFDKFIMNQIVKHSQLLREYQKQLINFHKNNIKNNKVEIRKLQNKCDLKLRNLLIESEEKKKKLEQDNKGQHMDLQKRIQEAQNLCKNEVNNIVQSNKAAISTIKEKQKLQQEKIVKKYIQQLLITKKINFSINKMQHKDRCQRIINEQLKQFYENKLIKFIGDALQSYGSSHYSFLIKSQSEFFRFESVKEFDKKTKAQDIKYVIDNLEHITMISHDSNPIFSFQDSQTLIKEYKDFQDIYEQIIQQIKKTKKHEVIKRIAQQLSSRTPRIRLIALILATWSILNSESSSDNKKTLEGQQQIMQQQQEIIIMKPHPAQVVAICLLTSRAMGDDHRSKLAQILTGEGKSLVLATLGIFFAKLDYQVFIACYSAYLCSRDFLKFQQLFKVLKVQKFINYNTINEVCQFALNGQKGDIKERIEKSITPPRGGFMQKTVNFVGNIKNKAVQIGKNITDKIGITSKKKNMLLIDEVDVLFDKNHFGHSFIPLLRLNHPSCKDLIIYVYNELKKNIKIQTSELCKSKQFEQVCRIYQSLVQIFKSQVHKMKMQFSIEAVPYEIHERKLKYKDNDTLSEKPHYGYQTIFANIKEYQNGQRISKQNYNNALFIPILFGQFSYAQLPKAFQFIIGLSGTIESLPNAFKEILINDYKFRRHDIFRIPSVYGKKHGATVNYMVQKTCKYYKKLVSLIKAQLQKNRPIVIGFSSYKQLSRFEESLQFKGLNIICNYLHLKLDDQLRDRAIKSAGCKGRVTLMTVQFSRGTDFIVVDLDVKNNGGMHLIATYLFHSESDYCQFIGRTGRQGEKGSVDILLQQQKIPQQFANKTGKQISSVMRKYWDKNNQLEYINIKQKLRELQLKHTITMSYLDKIQEKKAQYIKYLQSLNFAKISNEKKMKIIIGLDGTGSMGPVFRQLINTLNIIMKRIQEIKKEASIIGSFQMQIVVYRNYNVGHSNDEQHILQNSNYQQNVQNLKKYLSDLRAVGGWGNEAIEVLFRYINYYKDADMLILIGDAPPNTKKQVREKRNSSKDWEYFMRKHTKPYPRDIYIQTDVQSEEKNFSKDFIIHTLYINQNQYATKSPKQYFEQLARNHHGKSEELDFKNENCSQMLVRFMTTNILSLISGLQMRQTIENCYAKKYYN